MGINMEDPDVKATLAARPWPETVKEYAKMMTLTTCEQSAGKEDSLQLDKELGVDFTNRGDRAVVKYNFFKMSIDPKTWAREQGAAAGDEQGAGARELLRVEGASSS